MQKLSLTAGPHLHFAFAPVFPAGAVRETSEPSRQDGSIETEKSISVSVNNPIHPRIHPYSPAKVIYINNRCIIYVE